MNKKIILSFVLIITSYSFCAPLTHRIISKNQSSLTLYFLSSPHGLNWSGPKSITASLVKNVLSPKNRMLGHVAVELNCPVQNYYALTGMTDTGEISYNDLVLKDKIGFGVLFEVVPGQLEETAPLARELAEKLVLGKRVRFLSTLISQQTCERLVTYLEEYKANGSNHFYGLTNRPRYGEGAGCSAFGVSFLDVAGLLDQEFIDHWSYFIRFPERLIGEKSEQKKVSLFRLLLLRKKYNRWAKKEEAGRSIFFWDPDTMFNWAEEKIQTQSPSNFAYEIIELGQTKGLLIDHTTKETPTEPIWLF